MLLTQVRDGLQQVAVTLTWNQLADRGDHGRVAGNGELPSKCFAVGSFFESLCIDRAPNHRQPLFFDAPIAQYVRNCLGDGNDLLEGAIPKCRDETHLRVVHAARYHGGYIRKTGREPAQDVGTPSAVAVHDVGLRFADVLHKSVGERQVEVAGTKQVAHRDSSRARRVVDAGSGRANDGVVVTHVPERIDEVNHLLRTTVKMASGFDMQYVHRRRIIL